MTLPLETDPSADAARLRSIERDQYGNERGRSKHWGHDPVGGYSSGCDGCVPSRSRKANR